ncbi:hypothetical protein OBBRIDRAFT_572469 [Obba rivulosa]|uniref:Uncharacterized protein n=1 Tax=Obba rivulosa TaxID=1052685 RepID=A0A8E2DKT2_9APHY|nr:hypothetical protein OBBRIDRAFT_572469 [Obba rivulosa]
MILTSVSMSLLDSASRTIAHVGCGVLVGVWNWLVLEFEPINSNLRRGELQRPRSFGEHINSDNHQRPAPVETCFEDRTGVHTLSWTKCQTGHRWPWQQCPMCATWFPCLSVYFWSGDVVRLGRWENRAASLGLGALRPVEGCREPSKFLLAYLQYCLRNSRLNSEDATRRMYRHLICISYEFSGLASSIRSPVQSSMLAQYYCTGIYNCGFHIPLLIQCTLFYYAALRPSTALTSLRSVLLCRRCCDMPATAVT